MDTILTTERNFCPICKSENSKILFSEKHSSPEFLNFVKIEKFYSKFFYDSFKKSELQKMNYTIAECNQCQFIFQKEILSDFGMKLLYNQWLDNDLLQEFYSKQPYNKTEETILRILKKSKKKNTSLKILDFGAGYGNFCSKALKLGFQTYAFDLSSDKTEMIDKIGVITISNLEKFKDYFDIIWVNQVFEHISDPASVIDKLQECLFENGILFISTPNCKGIKKIIREKGLSPELFEKLSPHQHINAFTHTTLMNLGRIHSLHPMSVFDYIKLMNSKLSLSELVRLGKITLKNPFFDTNIFFKKKRNI